MPTCVQTIKLVLLVSFLYLAACSSNPNSSQSTATLQPTTDVAATQDAIVADHAFRAHIPDPTAQWLSDNCPFGQPAKTADFGPTVVIVRQRYVLEHSTSRKTPLWVEEHITASHISQKFKRGDLHPAEPFKADPELPVGSRAELTDYKSGRPTFDRGHMSPDADDTDNLQLMAQTYFLSNIVPQNANLNEDLWSNLEDAIRSLIRSKPHSDFYVITGGFIDPSVAGAAGTIGHDKVAVPTHIFKAVYFQDETGKWESIAFVLKNQTHASSLRSLTGDEIETVHQLEQRTQLNLMPTLPNAATVESTKGRELWPLPGAN